MKKEVIFKEILSQLTYSKEYFIGIKFEKSNSTSYSLAINFAQGASKYHEQSIGSKVIHGALFTKDHGQVARVLSLLKIIADWKSCQIYTETQVLANPTQVMTILECYLKSRANQDPSAHCDVVYRDLCFSEKGFVLPCQLLHGYFHLTIRDQKYHHAKIENRLHALSIDKGCNWCPNFKLSSFRELGTLSD